MPMFFYLTAAAQDLTESDSIMQFTATSFDTLIGSLPSIVKNRNHPYIVPSNIEVPPDRTVTIEPGTVLLFRNFSGLHIRGKLIALGTKDKPIIFSSEFDKEFNSQSIRDANPFDWDGIYMTIDALGSQMSHCTIAYSVYCITSESKYIRLDPVFFKDNGKNTVTIDNAEYQISDSSFTFKLDISKSYKDGIPIELFTNPVAKKRNSFRIIGSSLAIIGIGTGIYYAVELNKTSKKFDDLSQTDFENLNRYTNKDWKDTKQKMTTDKWMIGAGSLLLISGALFFTWTFTF